MLKFFKQPVKLYFSDIDKKGLWYLFIVYIIWSTTYLAIRFAVREGGGFPPFIFGATRVLVAGSLLLLWGKISHKQLKLNQKDAITLIVSGLLLWVGGNGMVLWAEQKVHSGYAALVIGTTPLWVAIIEALIRKQVPKITLVFTLLLGLGGITLLSLPDLQTGKTLNLISLLALIFAAISWGSGSVLQNLRQVSIDPIISSAYQQIFGGMGFLVLSFLLKEPFPSPSTEAWFALIYLILFGSIIGFTSFVLALKYLPVQLVMTYAYVNPVLALLLGFIILKEPLTIWVMLGSILIIASVYGVFKLRFQKNDAK